MKEWLHKNRTLLVALIATGIFLVANSMLIVHDRNWLFMLPLAALAIYLFVVKLETGLLTIALLTPFAIDFALLPQMELSMPVEPMMLLFTVIFLFRVLIDRTYDTRILRHPVTIAVIVSLLWMLISSCTSQLPWVSFKYLAARLWFVIPFFFAAVQIFRDRTRVRQFFWCYAIGLAVVILISTTKTLGNFSDLQTLHRVMRPFYNDHTAYGCVIALFLPAAFYFFIEKKNKSWWMRIFTLALFLLLVTGLLFSYSRAAWISVVAAVGVYVAIRMGIKVHWMMLLFGIGVGLFFYHQSDVLYKLGKNKQDSSYDIAGQVKSISNISTDASNLERLNRWASAFRMFKEHPVMGCGPGTYQFLYASYQRSYQRSVISTNFGNRGNAHSEYIGPLTEQGVPGAMLVVCIFMLTFATGVRVYRTAVDRDVANLSLAFTLSLLTYYVHGVFNNFLDTDKLSVPFWGFTAIIVALDLYSEKKPQPERTLQRRPQGVALLLAGLFFSVGAQAQLPDYLAYKDSTGRIPFYIANRSGDSLTMGDMLYLEAEKHLGTRYRWGGKTPAGFDCAGFTRYIYGKVYNIELAPSAGGQYPQGRKITQLKDLRRGDLAFWAGRHGSKAIGHVGMVVDVDTVLNSFYFIHSATSGGIRIDRSSAPYYKNRYIGACRVLPDQQCLDLPIDSLPPQPVHPCWHPPMAQP